MMVLYRCVSFRLARLLEREQQCSKLIPKRYVVPEAPRSTSRAAGATRSVGPGHVLEGKAVRKDVHERNKKSHKALSPAILLAF